MHEYEGYDGEYSVKYAICERGHEFAADDYDEVMEYLDDNCENDDFDWTIPSNICPICAGKVKDVIVTRLKKDMARLDISVEDLK